MLSAGKIMSRKTVIFPQCDGARRAAKLKNAFVTAPNHMYMCRTMVVWVNNNSQSAKPQNGWHGNNVSYNRSVWVFDRNLVHP